MIIYEDIFRAFQKQKIKYLLVGGIAVNIHGSFRNTADMDILVEISDKNLAKIVTILKRKGYGVKQPVDPMLLADRKTRQAWIQDKHMKAFNFYKDDELKEIDIIIDSPISFEEARKRAIKIKSGDITLPVISIDDLIKMKQKSNRPIDKLDITILRKIKRIKKGSP